MGVSKLWEILEPAKQVLPLEHLTGQCICVDLSCWIIQLNKVNGGNVKAKPHLRGLFHRIRALLALNCRLVFVADGAIPGVKARTYRKRLGTLLHDEDASSLKRNKGSEFGRMVTDSELLVKAFGLPCLTSLEEGEAQCAALNSAGICDACCTADSDAFLFGAGLVYRDISLGKPGEPGHVIVYDIAKITQTLGYGRKSLVALGILLGCDYFCGVRGLGPEKAQQLVKHFGEDRILDVMCTEGPQTLAKRFFRSSKTKANDLQATIQAGDGNTVRKAIAAYMNPVCHSATSEAVQRVLLHGRVELNNIRKLCLQNFEWPFEKTDEYVLNKLAERDVHRMAFMRLSNKAHESELQYKISNIIKLRMLQGIEHYEVEWTGMPEISHTSVPAEVVRRAYPSQVSEFNAKLTAKAAKRKTKTTRGPKAQELNMVTEELRLTNLNHTEAAGDMGTYLGTSAGDEYLDLRTSAADEYLRTSVADEYLTTSTADEYLTTSAAADEYRRSDPADIFILGLDKEPQKLWAKRGDSSSGSVTLAQNQASEVEIIDLTTPVKTQHYGDSKEIVLTDDDDDLCEVPAWTSGRTSRGGARGTEVLTLEQKQHQERVKELKTFIKMIKM